jgi:hypothetical protein
MASRDANHMTMPFPQYARSEENNSWPLSAILKSEHRRGAGVNQQTV